MSDFEPVDVVTAFRLENKNVTTFRNAKIVGRPAGDWGRYEYMVLPDGAEKPVRLLVYREAQANPEQYVREWQDEMEWL